jgi:tetratricopeptide (TPR) repeat protein
VAAGAAQLTGACGGPAVHRGASQPAGDPLAGRLGDMPPSAQLDTLRALASTQPDDARLQFFIGNAYYGLGAAQAPERRAAAQAYYDSAVTAYTRATEIDTAYSRAWVNKGLALDAGRKPDPARRAYQRAIDIDPQDVLAYCHLGALERAAGNTDAAVRLYQRALIIDPNSAQAHYNLGLAFAEAHIYAEALREWEAAAAADPDGVIGTTARENAAILRQYLQERP